LSATVTNVNNTVRIIPLAGMLTLIRCRLCVFEGNSVVNFLCCCCALVSSCFVSDRILPSA
jgi:hypothetical protein